jgi:hypothetical protein
VSRLIHPAPAIPPHSTSLVPRVALAVVLALVLIVGTVVTARR